MKIALVQEPKKIPIGDSECLMAHTKIMALRTKHRDMLESNIDAAQRNVDHAEHTYKKAKLTLDSLQLEADQLFKEARAAVADFFKVVREQYSEVRLIQERYGSGVRFMFDSDDVNVWVLVIFGSSAPPLIREDESEYSGQPFDPDLFDDLEEEGEE